MPGCLRLFCSLVQVEDLLGFTCNCLSLTAPLFNRFKNVTFDIMATEDMGIFDVRSKFLGVEMEKVQLNIQVSWDFVWGHRGSLCLT